jgi:hypothetical protein
MIKAASTSETSVNFYQTTRRNNPEDSHIHTRRRENLKSTSDLSFCFLFCFVFDNKVGVCHLFSAIDGQEEYEGGKISGKITLHNV